ncbi:HAD family hydrolase [Glaciimonas sp. Gout2]|uniref:HAD family hydrolase n=1 Tax=unclassified Glaciimonas TaxID=2644401 RepID=UPI002AB46AFF|nr:MULTISPECIES: HAD family hydrolase [unclassified Glaciimonas]MDY7548456.1 HAD family hydrolase [Glaciimonas sp. CA11.2]MEB0010395.1 HAD family hydrolase [Glaciimonas sp. Cout2]MEB0084406.1 HAD family hydrolase [Glaciimonas sp. Gout2]
MTDQYSSALTGRYSAFLFDMDGTLLNSIAAAERIWRAWAIRHGLDVDAFLPTIHGARAIDTITRLSIPGMNSEREAFGITQAEIADVEGIIEISGAVKFLRSLPSEKWAIVTSAPLALAIQRLKAAGVPVPAVMVTADDVANGKPNPACYLLAAAKLGVDVADCLIFEDADVGILAGEASGARVIVVTSTHVHPMDTPHASIGNYDTIIAKVDDEGFIVFEERTF